MIKLMRLTCCVALLAATLARHGFVSAGSGNEDKGGESSSRSVNNFDKEESAAKRPRLDTHPDPANPVPSQTETSPSINNSAFPSSPNLMPFPPTLDPGSSSSNPDSEQSPQLNFPPMFNANLTYGMSPGLMLLPPVESGTIASDQNRGGSSPVGSNFYPNFLIRTEEPGITGLAPDFQSYQHPTLQPLAGGPDIAGLTPGFQNPTLQALAENQGIANLSSYLLNYQDPTQQPLEENQGIANLPSHFQNYQHPTLQPLAGGPDIAGMTPGFQNPTLQALAENQGIANLPSYLLNYQDPTPQPLEENQGIANLPSHFQNYQHPTLEPLAGGPDIAGFTPGFQNPTLQALAENQVIANLSSYLLDYQDPTPQPLEVNPGIASLPSHFQNYQDPTLQPLAGLPGIDDLPTIFNNPMLQALTEKQGIGPFGDQNSNPVKEGELLTWNLYSDLTRILIKAKEKVLNERWDTIKEKMLELYDIEPMVLNLSDQGGRSQ